MMGIWVMSQPYSSPHGELPVAWSYGYNHSASGYRAAGPDGKRWGLVWLTLDAHQIEFLRSGADSRVEVVGTEWDEPTQLVLDTYKDKLEPGRKYIFMGQVLARLGQWEPRFVLDRRPDKP